MSVLPRCQEWGKGIDCKRARGNFWVMKKFYILIVMVITNHIHLSKLTKLYT